MRTKPNEVMKTFADRFGDLLAESNETYAKLAKNIDLSSGALCNYGNASQEPKATAILRIAKHFNVSSDWLLGLSNTRNPDADIQGIIKYTGLDEQAVETIIRIKDAGYISALNMFLSNSEPYLKELCSALKQAAEFSKDIDDAERETPNFLRNIEEEQANNKDDEWTSAYGNVSSMRSWIEDDLEQMAYRLFMVSEESNSIVRTLSQYEQNKRRANEMLEKTEFVDSLIEKIDMNYSRNSQKGVSADGKHSED